MIEDKNIVRYQNAALTFYVVTYFTELYYIPRKLYAFSFNLYNNADKTTSQFM